MNENSDGMKREFSIPQSLAPAQILVLGFLAAIAIGTVLLALPVASIGEPLDVVSAFFTATSAVCVTGLVVVDTGTKFTLFGQIVILVLIEVGGLGIATMSTLAAMLLGRRIGLRGRLVMQEALNQVTLSGMVRLTRYIVGVTASFQLIGAAILALRWWGPAGGPKAIWLGLFHAISAFNNAGFDLMGNFTSLTAYAGDFVVNVVVMVLLVSGGLGFLVIAELYNKRRRGQRLSLHTRMVLWSTAILLVIGFVAVLALEWNNPDTLGQFSPGTKLLAGLFQSATPRTAGFNTIPTGNLHYATLLLVMLLMFIGASPGGTGGGIKTTTFTSTVAHVAAIIRGKSDPQMFHRRIASDSARKAFAVASLALAVVVVGAMALTITEGDRFSFIQVLFETVSAFGTVGLSTGITTFLSDPGRILIAVIMFIGRVGPLTMVTALATPDTKHAVRFAEEKVVIG